MQLGEPQAADNPSWMSSPTNNRRSGGKARQTVKLSPQADARPTPLADNSTGYGQRLQRGAKAGVKIGPIRGLVARSGTVWPPLRTWRGVQTRNVLPAVVTGVQHVTAALTASGLWGAAFGDYVRGHPDPERSPPDESPRIHELRDKICFVNPPLCGSSPKRMRSSQATPDT